MRILHTESSNGWGGQEIRILQEAAGMRQRGYDVIIAANPESRLREKTKETGFETISVRFRRRNFLSITFFLKNLIEGKNIDIVNTHSSKDSWLTLPAARLAKNKPLAVRTRHLSTPIAKNFMSRFLYNVLPHVIITTGEAIKEQMIKINHFNPDKIISIPTGVDTQHFDPDKEYADIRAELNLPSSTPLIGTLSVIRSWKGLDFFVMAVPLIVKEMPDARFLIAGEGPRKKFLKKIIADIGIEDKVYLLGYREDVASILKSMDILVHPSYANEGVPQTILQAMAMRKPVIASDLPSLKEVIKDNKTGLLIPIKNPESIAKAAIRLLSDKTLATQLGDNGRKLVEASYSFGSMLEKIENLYAKEMKNV